MTGVARNMAKKHGHYCKVCGEYKSNESFSGSGHAAHICKKCAALPAAHASMHTSKSRFHWQPKTTVPPEAAPSVRLPRDLLILRSDTHSAAAPAAQWRAPFRYSFSESVPLPPDCPFEFQYKALHWKAALFPAPFPGFS